MASECSQIKIGTKFTTIFLGLLFLTLACDSNPLASVVGGNTVTVDIVYGSEKEEWLEPLVMALRRPGFA